MGTVGDYLTPDPPAPDEAAQHKAMLSNWTSSTTRAKNVAVLLQAMGDQLADFAASLPGMTPGLSDTDPAEWAEFVWPDAGVDTDDTVKHLRTAMAGIYAHAGAYRRAASELDMALRQQKDAEASE